MPSPLGRNKTKAHRARKQARHTENVSYRASLHQAKANASAQGGQRDIIQRQIDEISKRK